MILQRGQNIPESDLRGTEGSHATYTAMWFFEPLSPYATYDVVSPPCQRAPQQRGVTQTAWCPPLMHCILLFFLNMKKCIYADECLFFPSDACSQGNHDLWWGEIPQEVHKSGRPRVRSTAPTLIVFEGYMGMSRRGDTV